MEQRIGCIVMAAGLASRYGANKLLETLDGRTLIERTLDTVPLEAFAAAAVVAPAASKAMSDILSHLRGLGMAQQLFCRQLTVVEGEAASKHSRRADI